MDISEVRVKLVRDPGERLKAVCIVTFDEAFVVRDVKVVDGTNGLFVAMPSQKLAVHCPSCRQKNHLRARYCNECGKELPSQSIPSDANGRSRLHRDIAHPIRASFREQLQEHVIQAYQDEVDQEQSSDVEVETAAMDARPEEPVERQAEEPVALPADEPVDRPVDQPAPELDDYGAMIANLRGRSTGSSATRKSTGFGPDRAETEKKSTGSSRSSSERQRRDREPTPEDRPRDTVEREPAMAIESGAAEEVAPEPQIDTPSKRDAPGPTQDEKPDPAAENADAGAKDIPFGDGIL